MLTALIDWSLRNRLVVLAGGVCFVVLGLVSVGRLNIDAFPDTTPVQVQINTVAAALGPEDVEQQITIPIEVAVMATVAPFAPVADERGASSKATRILTATLRCRASLLIRAIARTISTSEVISTTRG